MVSRGEEERRRKRGQYLEKENVWRRKIVFFLWRRRRTEKENIENIWRREVVFCGGEEERRKIWRIFGKENSFFVEEKKNEEGKGGNYSEKRRKINVDVDRRRGEYGVICSFKYKTIEGKDLQLHTYLLCLWRI